MTEGDLAGIAADHIPGQSQGGVKKNHNHQVSGEWELENEGVNQQEDGPDGQPNHLILFPAHGYSLRKE
jgi:hypothetical protein